MPLVLHLTDAGIAAVEGLSGSDTVTIAELGITATPFTMAPTLTALPGEFKRIAAVAGEEAAPNISHMTAYDTSSDVWNATGFGIYTDTGILFGVYSQSTTVLAKAAAAFALIEFDIAFTGDLAASISFGDPVFTSPPATTEVRGIVELATNAEATAGTDALRALTAAAAKQAVLAWLLTQDGSGSGLDADLLDGQHGAWYADIPARLGFTPLAAGSYTAADILAKLITVDGSGCGLDADLLDGLDSTDFLRITASSMGVPGYIKFSNGLHIMWGSSTFAGSNTTTSIDYSTALGTSITLSVGSVALVSGGLNSDVDHNGPYTTGASTAGFTAHCRTSSSVTGWWIAIGL